MSLAAVPLAVALAVLTLTLTTPATTQDTTTPEQPDSNQPENNCTFTVYNTTYFLSEDQIMSTYDEEGTAFTWYHCEDGRVQMGSVSCRDTDQCADVTLGKVIDGNNTCVDCETLYENCPNDTETDSNNNSSNETETESESESESSEIGGDAPSTDDDSICVSLERGTDDCSRNPGYMFENCCNFCFMQRLVPLSEDNNDTLESLMNHGGP